MEIVTASILDLNALRKLENESFGKDAWPLFDLIAVLTFSEVIRLKAVEDGQMVGFVAGDPRPRDGWGWIATIAVDPRYQAARHRARPAPCLRSQTWRAALPFDRPNLKPGCNLHV